VPDFQKNPLQKGSVMVHVLTGLMLWFAHPVVSAAPAPSSGVHGVWIWDTAAATGTETELARLIATLNAIGASDAYLYLQAADYTASAPNLVRAVAALTRAGVRVWGLEGSREYFRDVAGPAALFAAAEELVAFNDRHAGNARFSGFVSDIEPQDGQGPEYPNHFHNDLPDSQLSIEQASERLSLMADWVSIHQRLGSRMRSAGLRYAAALPSWIDNYYSEPVHVVASTRLQGVTEILMECVDDYIVMSYSTNPQRIVDGVLSKTDYADRLGRYAPRVFAAVETHRGVGRGISYGDDPTKGTKTAVLSDIQAVLQALSRHPSFAGVDIHDWAGWSRLPR
jgi:hypothetical protein